MLPSALQHVQEIAGDKRQLAVFLDFDGTLTPIVSRPEESLLPDSIRETLQALAAKQEQMAQDITMLQSADEDIGQRLSSPPVSEKVPLPRSKKPMVAPKQSTAQSTSAPHLAPVGLPFLQGSP